MHVIEFACDAELAFQITVQVKWCGKLCRKIHVCVGTRQGGLSSPFLFNIFYHDFISILSNCTGGITIHNESYNVVCYADDLIISFRINMLQRLFPQNNASYENSTACH